MTAGDEALHYGKNADICVVILIKFLSPEIKLVLFCLFAPCSHVCVRNWFGCELLSLSVSLALSLSLTSSLKCYFTFFDLFVKGQFEEQNESDVRKVWFRVRVRAEWRHLAE